MSCACCRGRPATARHGLAGLSVGADLALSRASHMRSRDRLSNAVRAAGSSHSARASDEAATCSDVVPFPQPAPIALGAARCQTHAAAASCHRQVREPLKLAIGDKLTIRGTNFVPGKRQNTVVFLRPGAPAVCSSRPTPRPRRAS